MNDNNAIANFNTDRDLIQRVQSGDPEAFSALFYAHKPRVYSVCLRMTGNPSLAEDLTQEAFLQVFRKIHTFRAESAFSTWLHRLAVNIVLMRQRVKRLDETPLDATYEMDGETLPVRELGTVDSGVSGLVDRLNLQRALGELPRGYRRAFVLHDVLGYEHHEIAQALGCSIGTSKSQLHKARMRLRKILRSSTRPKLSAAMRQ